jgi:hypothetical protein
MRRPGGPQHLPSRRAETAWLHPSTNLRIIDPLPPTPQLPFALLALLRPPPKSSTMAKKQAAPPTPVKQAQSTPAKQPTPAPVAKASTLSPRSSPQEIVLHVWDKYIQDTPSRTLFLDVFLLYLVLNGAVQFVYCVIGGNYVRSHATPLSTPMSPIGAIERGISE